MVLDAHPSYPSARSYVLKLHRDADPGRGKLFGRVERLVSGEQFAFANAQELLAVLAADSHAEAEPSNSQSNS